EAARALVAGVGVDVVEALAGLLAVDGRAALTAEFVAWLAKKAREHRAQGPRYATQADVIGRLADQVSRGAVRPNNLRSLPAQGGPEDLPALRAEVARLRDRVDELVQQRDDLLVEDARAETQRDAAEPGDTERSRWEAIAAALNAVPVIGIDLDGTITDHATWSVVWDRRTERWVVAHADEGETGGAR
ncbi:hypothetical protein, partial [Streptomyces chumphonensis]|uniref:hypothetical protein n=1 Tax=Streptomyces chumphonensis TaxID=1214925 RepID=UPI003D75ED87